jgi:hypothetical protein
MILYLINSKNSLFYIIFLYEIIKLIDSFYILEYYKTNKCREKKSSLGMYLKRARGGEN